MTNKDVALNCRDFPLERMASGALKLSDTPRLHSHLEECRDCQERLQVMLGLQFLLEDWPAEPDSTSTVPFLRTPSQTFHGLSHRKVGNTPPTRLYGLAAILMLTLLASTAIFLATPSRSIEPQASLTPHPIFRLETRVSDRDSALAPTEAFEAYQQRRYQEAAAVLASYPEDPEASFYRGVSLYLLGHLKEAAQVLIPLTSDGATHRSDALWFLAQVRLRQGRTAEAQAALSGVTPANRYFEAVRLLLLRLHQESEP